jgi:pyridoxamine 5'-phosphate oxidase
MSEDPIALFDAWYAEARTTEINDSNAVALATADAEGRPSVRMVLLKGHGPDGFVIYTNRESRKAGDLAVNRYAALLFHWKSLQPPSSRVKRRRSWRRCARSCQSSMRSGAIR